MVRCWCKPNICGLNPCLLSVSPQGALRVLCSWEFLDLNDTPGDVGQFSLREAIDNVISLKGDMP